MSTLINVIIAFIMSLLIEAPANISSSPSAKSLEKVENYTTSKDKECQQEKQTLELKGNQ